MALQAPNFDRLANSFLAISEETTKFNNLPSFDQGARILQIIERIDRNVQRLEQQIEHIQETQTQMQQSQAQMQLSMQQMFNRFESRAIASNHNTTARVQNSIVTFADRRLNPLVNSVTGEDIENFPDTAASLSRMQTAVINPILTALEHGVAGTLEERRDRLRKAIGVQVGGV